MSSSVTVRMYDQLSLGDCFLLRFTEGREHSFVLIDFGSYTRNEEREKEIAQSIAATVGSSPLKIVLTHQHRDHFSGFISAAAELGKLNVGEVWLSYLDDPKSGVAEAMRKATRRFWERNEGSKKSARERFGHVKAVAAMLKAKDGLDLFAEEQKGGEAISNLLKWCRGTPRFLEPGQSFSLPGLPVGAVRVYVLGPPTTAGLMSRLNPGKDEAVHSLGAISQLSGLDTSLKLLEDALCADEKNRERQDFPFLRRFTLNPEKTAAMHAIYERESFRKIDHDWLGEMGRASLHMDRLTNNSSLVLAFELVEQKKVLLFVGDAQAGSWQSWLDVKFDDPDVNAEDLLSRTVLYKAGHHSSHNATLLQALNLMNEDELVIMIPVSGEVSSRMGFAMLKPGMMAGYNRKTQGRVLRSDTIYHEPGTGNLFRYEFVSEKSNPLKDLVKGLSSAGGHLFIEYKVG